MEKIIYYIILIAGLMLVTIGIFCSLLIFIKEVIMIEFCLGFIVGVFIGVLILGLLKASKDDD